MIRILQELDSFRLGIVVGPRRNAGRVRFVDELRSISSLVLPQISSL